MSIIPAAGAFALCLLWGIERSTRLKKRALLLAELKQLITEFSVAIRCTAPTLDELVLHCSGVFGELLRQQLANSPDVRCAWAEAVLQLSHCSFCGSEEASILSDLGRDLGTCSAEGQLSLLTMHLERLSRLCAEAEQDRKIKGKLFRSVGTLTGLGAAILIL